MRYIYTRYWEKEGKVHKSVFFECEAVDILEADKKLTARFGFKMSDKTAMIDGQKQNVSWITTWSPDWNSSK